MDSAINSGLRHEDIGAESNPGSELQKRRTLDKFLALATHRRRSQGLSGVGTRSERILRMMVRADQGAQCGGFSLEGFAEGEGPRPAGIAVGDVSAQIDAIVLGEIEAAAKAASRQEIFRGERLPRWSDFADTGKRGKAPTRRENPAVLGLHSKHPVLAVSPRLVATD